MLLFLVLLQILFLLMLLMLLLYSHIMIQCHDLYDPEGLAGFLLRNLT